MYSRSKMKTLSIYLYLSDHKKTIPKNATDILSSINVNTAVTTACSINGEILVYRKEEWFKVFIHETFHSLCLDFSGFEYNPLREKLKNLFKINSKYEVSESYTEFWATIMNTLFISYDLLDDKSDIALFRTYFNYCIYYEKCFSILQTIKVLNFMNLNYEHIYSNKKDSVSTKKILYKENTNVFAYYILKMILLFYYDDFFNWCDKNNINLCTFKKIRKIFQIFLNLLR